MKKSPKKLKLSRETLQQLDDERVRGGVRNQDPNPDTGPVWTGPFYAGCPSYGNYCTMDC